MSAEEFLPAIWEFRPEGTNEAYLFLVCVRRWMHGDPVMEGVNDDGKVHNLTGPHAEWGVTGRKWDWVGHPVAIRYGHLPLQLHYGKWPGSGDWFGRPIDEFGLSLANARAALRHAYRTVSALHDLGKATLKQRIKPSILASKGHSVAWKITAHICWPEWDKEKISLAARADLLCEMGYKVTTQALRSEMKRAGVSC